MRDSKTQVNLARAEFNFRPEQPNNTVLHNRLEYTNNYSIV